MAQPPKEQLSEGRPAEGQPAKEQPKEQPAAEKAKPCEAVAAADAVTVEAAHDAMRRLLPSKFSYAISPAGEASAGGAVAFEVKVNYGPLTFDGCTIKWRDQNDILSASLPELDPEAVRVEPRSRPGATFSIEA